MKTVIESEFNEAVLNPSFHDPIVVMFHASWCGPCKTMKPMVESLAEQLNFALIGIDAGSDRALATFYGVRGVPTLAVFRDGRVVDTLVGGKTERQVRDFLNLTKVTQNEFDF